MERKEEIEKGLKYFEEHKDRLVSLYNEMYGETICLTCPGSVPFAFEKIYRDRDKVFATIKMKKGKVINTHMWDESKGFPKDHYTCHNMTDELAIRFIEAGYGDYFL